MNKKNQVGFSFKYPTYGLDYIEKLYSIFELSYIPKENRLTKKEKVFYYNLVFLYNMGVDLNTPEATKRLQEVDGLTLENRGVYIYKSILKKKKWIMTDKNGKLDIPPFLKKGDGKLSFFISLSHDI